jgi:hypothetical protein
VSVQTVAAHPDLGGGGGDDSTGTDDGDDVASWFGDPEM